MKSKLITLMMALALFTNVMVKGQTTTTVLYDVDFNSNEWLDAFLAAGYNFRDSVPITTGTNPGIAIPFGSDATYVLNINGGFNINGNGFKDVNPGFTSVCGRTFQYCIRLRNGAVTFIQFPGQVAAGTYKMTLYVNNPNATTKSTFYLTDGLPDLATCTDGKETGTNVRWIPPTYLATASISESGAYSPGQVDEEIVIDNITIDNPVSLTIWRDETRFLKVYRIILEKYNDNTSIQSPVNEKTDLFVTGKTLSLSGNVNNADLSVFNLAGIKVFYCKVNSNKVDLQDISAGAYIVKLITQEGETVKKVIIK